MIDMNMAKALLRKAEYERVKDRLSPDMFGEDVAEFYEVIEEGHSQTEGDLTAADIMALWKSMHPVATRSSTEAMYEAVDDIMSSTDISPDVLDLTIGRLWRRKFGTRLANLGLQISEGDDSALDRIRAMLDDTEDSWGEDDLGEDLNLDLANLIASQRENGCFKINIPALISFLPGVGRKQFGIAFAGPNTGKTTFSLSLVLGPGGFASQGYKTLYLGNEEDVERTGFRAYQAYFGMSEEDVIFNEQELHERFKDEVRSKIVFRNIQDKLLSDVEAIIKKHKPDIVIIDQLDKVHIRERFDAGHERIRELYRQTREVAKRQDCFILGISQASNDAKNRTQVTSDMMEGSKIGKAAEADIIFGIGMTDIEDKTRYITISKNKISGWHGTVIAMIDSNISRYVA